jgi:hypothetical protein
MYTSSEYSIVAKLPDKRHILNSNSKIDSMINRKYKKTTGVCNKMADGIFIPKTKIATVGRLISIDVFR